MFSIAVVLFYASTCRTKVKVNKVPRNFASDLWEIQYLVSIPSYNMGTVSGGEIVGVKNFIKNEFSTVSDHLDSFEPSKGKVWAKIPDSDASHVVMACAPAKEAFKL